MEPFNPRGILGKGSGSNPKRDGAWQIRNGNTTSLHQNQHTGTIHHPVRVDLGDDQDSERIGHEESGVVNIATQLTFRETGSLHHALCGRAGAFPDDMSTNTRIARDKLPRLYRKPISDNAAENEDSPQTINGSILFSSRVMKQQIAAQPPQLRFCFGKHGTAVTVI